ncbi:MAG: hypothetical protein BGO63_03275 [Candidatus Accumulibacter sp. 66-26]|nr:hypothetical protein [Accumulibacter sp.]OJW48206.1 MAG: hypothetical protein BGO63_03275 [Candidatus Accumulibacter sp. 66-26]
MHASFVSLGQLIKFAYDATGVLPRKRSEKTGLNDKDIKRIQKQLERLIDEEGSLTDRCGELIQALAFELTGTIQNPKVNYAIGETMVDLLEVYKAVVRDDGTYLSPKDSLRWFCGAYAIPRLQLSIHKHALRFNVAAEGFLTPTEADWYLPTISGTSITWPLEKAINWAYKQCRSSRAQFHSPGKVVDQDDPESHQNLENASNWLSGEAFPSWPGLHWNFSRSIDRLVATEEPYGRSVSEKEKESILYVLFLARLSTYVTKALHDAYGAEVLIDMVGRFKRHRDWLAVDLKVFKAETLTYIERYGALESASDKIWLESSDQYWRWFADRAQHCAMTMQRLLDTFDDHIIPDDLVTQLCDQYGDYTARSALDSMYCASDLKIQECFPEALFKGFDLKKSSSTMDADINAYEAEIKEKGLTTSLEWMVHWNRAALFYKKEQHEEAFVHIQKAFDLAKYSAGKNQYQIVNQYIELSAKNNS